MGADIADVFRRHGSQYLDRYKDSILPSHHRALRNLSQCRTAAMGGHLCRCDRCAALHYRYHSCRNRSCPTCLWNRTDQWIRAKSTQLLPVPYFHLVFTLPSELRRLVRSNQKALLSVLFRAATSSLMDLARDPHYIGGKIGILAVLHTWTRAMVYHPHLHCLVPGGGLSPDGDYWLPTRSNYLVPVKALSVMFRARYMDMARKALPEVRFPQAVWQKPWVVYSKPALQGFGPLLRYLGR